MRHLQTLLAVSLSMLSCPPASAEQLVVLDFDTFTDAISDDGKDHVYSAAERTAIVATLNEKFAAYPVVFASTAPPIVEPPFGQYSTVYFNEGLSEADDIDFRNTIKNDDAEIHIPKLLEVAGLIAPFASADVITASINIAAHETLHLLGTRHHDSYLPIGGGVPTSTIGGDYTPMYFGPPMATLAAKEFNSLTTSLGFSEAKLLDTELFVGLRSAVKLLHEEYVEVTVDSNDANLATSPQHLELRTIPIPNPFPDDPVLGSVQISADVAIVTNGAIESLGPVPESDYYSISAEKGDLIHIEVLSDILDFRLSPFDAAVVLRNPDSSFEPLLWPTAFGATSFDERESSDAFLWDVPIPETGTYVIEVTHDYGPGTSDGRKFGDYELLVYRFEAVVVPEPDTSLLVAAISGCMLLAFVRRWPC